MKKYLCIIISFCILVFIGCGSPKKIEQSNKKALIICEKSTYPMVADLVENYNANSEETAEIKLVENVLELKEEKSKDYAIISYGNKKLQKLNKNPLGIDAVAIVVDKEKGILNITTEELNKIYNGTINNWKDISKNQGEINILIFKGMEKFLRIENKVQYIDETKALNKVMDKDKNTIAFIPKMQLSGDLTYIKLDNVELNSNNIKNGLYKITLPINMYYNPKSKEALSEFIKYVKSDNGKKIIKKYCADADKNS
ncbi:substrate-binding domain-containing protein [Clostridium sp. KNHs214]|uniref:substrate-binding domain-containing protein n=1 Tax=Clostridium sp. KNHs214 TaxID=1540257 RepID=UPI00054DF28B|nr:substrate-binding domain-containing protein [Clostridium sp. KNHs214]